MENVNLKDLKKIYTSYALKNGYEATPPTITEFLSNDFYLGKIGKYTFKYWKNILIKIYPTPFPEINKTIKDDEYSKHYITILSGGIGIGKTHIANIILLYDLCVLLHLKSPQEFYKLPKSQKIDFIVSNSNKENSESINFATLIGMIRQSPFFISKLNNQTKQSLFIKNIDLLPVPPLRRALTGRALFGAVIDELNRIPSLKQGEAYITEAINRLPSRFLSTHNNEKYIPGHLCIISSADTDISFIEKIKNSLEDNDYGSLKKPILYLAPAQFEVLKEKINYSKETFKVFIGTYDQSPKILETEEDIKFFTSKYPDKVFDVPMDFYLSFKQNLYQAIGDILGKPTISSSTFIPDFKQIQNVMKIQNPIIDVYDEYDNEFNIMNLINIDLLTKYKEEIKGKEVHIGLDLAFSNDRLGIALGYIKGIKKTELGFFYNQTMESKNLYEKEIEIFLAFGIKAKKGLKLKFKKIREFIIELRNFGFNITTISMDTFQSYDFIEILKEQGFDAKQFSVDRKKEPYYALRNAIVENSIILPKNDILFKELRFLKEDEKKIDHPETFPDGTIGSKDIADAVTQCYNSLLTSTYQYWQEKDFLETINKAMEYDEVINYYNNENEEEKLLKELLGL